MSNPVPIPVRLVRFTVPMDGPGLSVASACKSEGRFAVSYLPWMRHFLIEYTPPNESARPCYVHETLIKSWEPVPAPVPEPVQVELPSRPVSSSGGLKKA